jgi:hypothetical protein
MAAETSTSRMFPRHQKVCRTSGVCSSRHTQSLAACLFPTIGFSDAGINALQDHRPSSFVHPLPVPPLAQGGRLAGRSRVSPQVDAACKRAVTALAMGENPRDLKLKTRE